MNFNMKFPTSSAEITPAILVAWENVKSYYYQSSYLDLLKDILLALLAKKIIDIVYINVKCYGIYGALKETSVNISKQTFRFLLSTVLKSKIDKEVKVVNKSIEDSMIHNAHFSFPVLPEKGIPKEKLMEILDDYNSIDTASDWQNGRISGGVYHGGQDLIDLQTETFHKFAVSNQLHPDAFPGLRQMESEIVSMVLKMFNAPSDTGCGTTTSGGTESLLLAVLSARNYGYQKKGITEPEVVAPVSIHAAVAKGCEYFKIKLRLVPLDKDYRADLKAVKRMINKNTVLVLGSAPNFPHGIIDDMQGLSDLCYPKGIPLHTDCCLGSFLIAHMEKAGYTDLPLFDFRLKGVTSISCDTHKYGFAPKGSSVILYRNNELRQAQYFIFAQWLGGLYGSPTLAGSRPGALSAGCWATMLNIGDKGYTESCKSIIEATRRLKKAIIEEIPELEILGDPKVSVISFTSKILSVHTLGDMLNEKGWHLSTLQQPSALHIALTRLSTFVIDDLIAVLKETVAELKAKGPKAKESDTAVVYGVAGSIKTGSVVDKFVTAFLDTMYRTDKIYSVSTEDAK